MVIASTAAVLLAGCNKEQNSGTPDGERAVRITISQEGTTTRGVGNQVSDKTPVTFNDGLLLFADANDDITMVVSVTDDDAGFAGSSVGKEKLDGGVWITGVPDVSTQVFFVGNPPTGTKDAAEVGADVADLELTVSSQYDGGGVGKVTLWGGKALGRRTGTGPDGSSAAGTSDFEASFDVKAVVTRLEIGAITGTHSTEGSLTYKVEGIFIDKYYDAMKANGTAITTAGNLKENGAAMSMYAPGGNDGGTPAVNSSYTTAMSGVVYDWDTDTGLATDAATAPEGGKAWAYNLLAPASTGQTMPKILVRIDDVKVDGVAWPGPHFLTISKFYSDPGTNQKPITALEPGHIYTISNLKFKDTDLSPVPYASSHSAHVTVKMLPWESAEVGYDIN